MPAKPILSCAVGVAVLVLPTAAAAQAVERGVLLGIGSADTFEDAGEGLLFFGAVTFQHSEHVFIDLEVSYITRDFERQDGSVSVRGKDLGAAMKLCLTSTARRFQPFAAAGAGLMRSSHRLESSSSDPIPEFLTSLTDTVWDPFLQFGAGVRIVATDTFFLQAELRLLYRVEEGTPQGWQLATFGAGYSF